MERPKRGTTGTSSSGQCYGAVAGASKAGLLITEGPISSRATQRMVPTLSSSTEATTCENYFGSQTAWERGK